MSKFENTSERKSAKNILILVSALFLSSLNLLWAQEELGNVSMLPKFQSIHVSGLAKVFFTQEEPKEIEMIVSGDPYPQVIRKVDKGVLEIYTKGEAHNEVVEVFVSSPTLTSIRVSDSAEFHTIKDLEMKTLSIAVEDVGSAEVSVNVKQVAIHMDGGDLTISGTTHKQKVTKSRASRRGTLDNSGLKISH